VITRTTLTHSNIPKDRFVLPIGSPCGNSEPPNPLLLDPTLPSSYLANQGFLSRWKQLTMEITCLFHALLIVKSHLVFSLEKRQEKRELLRSIIRFQADWSDNGMSRMALNLSYNRTVSKPDHAYFPKIVTSAKG